MHRRDMSNIGVSDCRFGVGRSQTVVGPGSEVIRSRHVEHSGFHHQLAVHCDLHPQTCRLSTGNS